MGSASILLAAAGMLPAVFQAGVSRESLRCSQRFAVKTVRQNAGHSGQNARAPFPVLFFAP